MAKVESMTTDAIHALVDPIKNFSNCASGPVPPAVPAGQTVLWLDTSDPAYVSLKLIIGEEE